MRPLPTLLLAVLLLLPGCSTGDDMTMLEARDQIRAVVGDLAGALGGTVTVSDEYVTPAAATQAGGDDELVYSLSVEVDVTPERAREAVADGLAADYRGRGWAVELDAAPDVPLRLTRNGALVAVQAGELRDGALVVGTSGVVPTPEGVRPRSAQLPFAPYTPPS